uniref:Peptidase S1 domain-containing protein n=1 Tax=Pelusios castaneus TaxID=367368 RepID=A0A8C8RWV9_9SAUR
MLLLFLLPTTFLLPPGAWSGDIIGGKEAQPHSRPYMAVVGTENNINSAHCDEEGSGEAPNLVILGAHNLSQEERTQQRITVQRKIPHENFNPETLENDIMLLKLKSRAKLTSAVKPIPLPPANFLLQPEAECSVAGWGKTGVHRLRFPDKLQEVALKMADKKQCERLCESFNWTSMLCMGNSKTKQSSFKGDSGGPLVCNGVAQGIMSHGTNSGLPPAAYRRISAFIPWLRKMGRE